MIGARGDEEDCEDGGQVDSCAVPLLESMVGEGRVVVVAPLLFQLARRRKNSVKMFDNKS